MIVTRKRKPPKWMKLSYEERVASRDSSSAKRRRKLEAKGKVQSLGIAIPIHSCGSPTILEKRGDTYASYCQPCGAFAIV